MTLLQIVLLAHLAATWYLVGLIWFVQVVHYPLFDRVDPAGFRVYEADHQRLTSLVVGPPMLLEMLTAVLLCIHRPPEIASGVAWLGLGLLVLVWLSTALVQIPLHNRLASHGHDAAAIRWLVRTNGLRTVAWTLRGLLALGMIAALLRK